MPRPTSATTLQRPDLSTLAYEYMLDADRRGFIGLSILPIFEVPQQSADYPKIPTEALLKLQETKRAPRSAYPRSDYEFETGTYACVEYGWEEPIDDVEASLYRRFFDAEVVANMRAVDILLRGQEKRIADAVMSTSNITNTADVTTEWSTAASCTPHADVETAKEAMRAATGLLPNAIAMTYKVFTNVLKSKELKDAFRYTNPIEIGGLEMKRRLLAQYFGVDQVLVGGAIYDSTAKGQSTTISAVRSCGRRILRATWSWSPIARSRPGATSSGCGTTSMRRSSSRARAICWATSRRNRGCNAQAQINRVNAGRRCSPGRRTRLLSPGGLPSRRPVRGPAAIQRGNGGVGAGCQR